MKNSTIETGSMASMHTAQHPHESLISMLRHALRTFFLKLDQMGTAIALGEAGDLEGAQALRKKHAK